MMLQFVLCSLLIVALFAFPTASHLGAEQGLEIFLDILLPYVLPYLLLTNWLFALLQRVVVSKRTAFTVSYITSAIGGYPVGAIACLALYKQQIITKRQASFLLPFLHSPNPFFIINYVAGDLLQNVHFSVTYLILHHALSICGVIFIYKQTTKKEPQFAYSQASFQTIIEQTISTALTIAVTIIFFSSFTYICVELFSNTLPITINALLIGALELTNGTQFAAEYLTGQSLLIYFAFLLSSQSVSIHVQVAAVTYGHFSLRPYVLIRLFFTLLLTALFLFYN
ncbi:MAG: hypothetical protein ABS882_10545 [Lysinibacillus sp.]